MPLPITIALIAILITLIGLLFNVRNYERKAGISIRGSYIISFSRDCDDPYVSKITLENTKDRAITIYSIYLKVGNNNYIEIDNFENAPLIVKAFETYKKDYGPLEYYAYNLQRFKINKLLSNFKVRKQLVLSTSEGKYRVPMVYRSWSPNDDYLRNHLVVVTKPIRNVFKGRAIGNNVRYVIHFILNNGEEEIIPLHLDDYRLKIFNDFNLSKHDLESKSALESLLKKQISNGTLKCKSYEIVDVEQWREKNYNPLSNFVVQARNHGFLRYYLGRIESVVLNWKNKRLMIKSKKR